MFDCIVISAAEMVGRAIRSACSGEFDTIYGFETGHGALGRIREKSAGRLMIERAKAKLVE